MLAADAPGGAASEGSVEAWVSQTVPLGWATLGVHAPFQESESERDLMVLVKDAAPEGDVTALFKDQGEGAEAATMMTRAAFEACLPLTLSKAQVDVLVRRYQIQVSFMCARNTTSNWHLN